ncbi:MAG: hypothetical protein OEV37_02145 [Candidatus Berkelbacteria bacterium]|nr:hypothetical protein [Candidatus Berkelbacteria bacterium]
MEDPFGLASPSNFRNQKEGRASSPKRYFWVMGAMLGVITLLSFGLFFAFRGKISADVNGANYQASVAVSGLPQELTSGEQFLASVSLNNKKGSTIRSGFILVQGSGVDLSETLSLSQNLSSSEVGYVRRLNSEEEALFEEKGESGFYLFVGDLAKDQTKSNQFKGTVSATGSSRVKLEVKYYVKSDLQTNCGFLGLSKCSQESKYTQVGYAVATVSLSDQGKIKLRVGYNFITLPYVFTLSAAQSFLGSLDSGKWAYYFDPTSGGYIDLNSGNNAEKLKPGVGFWVKVAKEGDYALPSPRVDSNISESYSVPLAIGENHIGNPYPKRIIWSGTDILVQELDDAGEATGISYSLKTAIDNQIIGGGYVISYKSFTDSTGTTNDLSSLIEYKPLPLGSYLNSTMGLTIQSTKMVNLVFPGRAVIAPGDLLSDSEMRKIEEWIIKNGLNQFGDPSGTAYSSGTPLIDSATGWPIDRYDYIVSKHSDRPWNR